MRFGKTLRAAVYPPWKGKYIDYTKLKTLLRENDVTRNGEDASDSDDDQWTEQDEETFVQELLNVELDKVNSFQAEMSQQLRERTTACEVKLRPLASTPEQETPVLDEQKKRTIASEVLQELDNITKEVSALEKYSRINFTGFLKAAKKHDRKRGARYRVKPLLQVRLSQLPFNSEDYSPLVHRLSVMYSFVRETLSHDIVQPREAEHGFGRETYSSYKFWVHSDNVLEVKTHILRRLPVLIYRPGTSKDLDTITEDPTITSLYFDTPQFDLYNQKVARAPEAGSLRLRWTGSLKDKPTIQLEKKIVTDDDESRQVKVQLKDKHIKEFLDGEYRFDKKLHRMEDSNNGDSAAADALKKDVDELQSFIKENDLQPMLRANYTRTAFQIPGNDRIRISLDTNLALIREDSLDSERPCRDPAEWHRTDLDDADMTYPFNAVRTGEITRFPHALLEIQLRGKAHNTEWVKDLMVSHLVKDAPRFSKFVHGVASLFEDYVNSFPFWLGELESDIRRDPETAFHEEQERLARRAEENIAVGSFMGDARSPGVRPQVGSPYHQYSSAGSPSAMRRSSAVTESAARPPRPSIPEPQRRDTEPAPEPEEPEPPTRLESIFQFLGLSPQRWLGESVSLPPGVRHPGVWIKDAGPVRVESKVYLANQRTFIKWLHISILLSSLSLGLYNAAGKHNQVAQALAVVYTFFAIFAAVWGWFIYERRARLIRQRSGKDLDNMFGPIVVCIGLAIALVLNFFFKYSSALSQGRNHPLPTVPIHSNSSAVFDSGSGAINPADTFSLHWKAFYLNPAGAEYPGVNKADMYAGKFGAERAQAIFARLSAVGKGEGIQFSFGGNTGLTRDSHRLLWFAGQREAEEAAKNGGADVAGVIGGLQTRVAEQLFRAYFEDEKNITDLKVLLEAGVGAGLDRETVKKMLDEDVGAQEVDLEAKTAARRLVSGVPYISVQGKYHIEGADEPEVFLDIFEKVKAEQKK
ncbi:SPX, N-terminal [Penicillium italicum]|uniref:SPX, N-terminal n=1 Tax=Penicillium italicum TaxID=40296 RepID=A0A0A2KTI6_PENIT|nr:SPX, N-terminal [Penicillium italicum]